MKKKIGGTWGQPGVLRTRRFRKEKGKRKARMLVKVK